MRLFIPSRVVHMCMHANPLCSRKPLDLPKASLCRNILFGRHTEPPELHPRNRKRDQNKSAIRGTFFGRRCRHCIVSVWIFNAVSIAMHCSLLYYRSKNMFNGKRSVMAKGPGHRQLAPGPRPGHVVVSGELGLSRGSSPRRLKIKSPGMAYGVLHIRERGAAT